MNQENLKEILGDGYSAAEIKALIDDADQDKDGQSKYWGAFVSVERC